jgi:hypothetical protein
MHNSFILKYFIYDWKETLFYAMADVWVGGGIEPAKPSSHYSIVDVITK